MHLQAVESPVHIVPKEEIVGVRALAPHPEELYDCETIHITS